MFSLVDELKVCTGYQYNGKLIDIAYPGINLEDVEPVFEEFSPFNDKFDGSARFQNLNRYIELIEKSCQIPIGIIAFGREKSDTI